METPSYTFTKRPSGTFIFVDDSQDEQRLLRIAMKTLQLNNPVRCFFNGQEALNYLCSTSDDIFLILSDLSMPVMNGLEFKKTIESTPALKSKSIPFIFHSNSGNGTEIREAYCHNIQGYFQKAESIEGTISCLHKIVCFWVECIHPKDL